MSIGEPNWSRECNGGMTRSLRAGLVGAALLMAIAAYRWLGAPLQQSAPTGTLSRPTVGIAPVSPTPVDMYDVMGTLTINGRTIPSARLSPAEYSLVKWIDDSGAQMNEIRPAEGWPSPSDSLPSLVRGTAVVHALLVPPETVTYDVVGLTGTLNPSVCATSSGGQIASYHLRLGSVDATIDSAPALYFATYGGALMISSDGDALSRLGDHGALTISPGNCVSNSQ